MIEIWKDIVGYEGYYKISNIGNIMSLINDKYHPNNIGKMLSQSNLRGYKRVSTRFNGERLTFSVHREVAKAFIPNPKNLKTVNHKNLDKGDNRVENLEWMSIQDNIKHRDKYNINNRSIKCEFNGINFPSIRSMNRYKKRIRRLKMLIKRLEEKRKEK